VQKTLFKAQFYNLNLKKPHLKAGFITKHNYKLYFFLKEKSFFDNLSQT